MCSIATVLAMLFISFKTTDELALNVATTNKLNSKATLTCYMRNVRHVTFLRVRPDRCIVMGNLTTQKILPCGRLWDADRMRAVLKKTRFTLYIKKTQCSDFGLYVCDSGQSRTAPLLLGPVFTAPELVEHTDDYATVGVKEDSPVRFSCNASTGPKGQGSLRWHMKGPSVDDWLGEEGPNIKVSKYQDNCTEVIQSTLTLTVTPKHEGSTAQCYVVNPSMGRDVDKKNPPVCNKEELCAMTSPIKVILSDTFGVLSMILVIVGLLILLAIIVCLQRRRKGKNVPQTNRESSGTTTVTHDSE